MHGTIKSKQEIERLFQNGRRSSSSLMTILIESNPSNNIGIKRFAFIAGKKLGSAPFRNRCKRVLRATAAELYDECANANIIFIAKYNIAHASHDEAVSTMRRQLYKAGVLNNEKEQH